MKSFVASVKLVFHNAFSQEAGRAKSSFDGIKDSLAGMQAKGAAAMQTATQLSLIASSTEQYRQRMISALKDPSDAAKGLESALAAASTVVTPELSINGDYGKTMEALRQRALAWGDGTAEGASLAAASADSFASTTYSMLSAGLHADAAMNATAQAMILAKGTMGDARDAASLLAIAYNTMGDKSVDSAGELRRLSDVVAKTQAAFQIANLTQLNDGLKYGIPVAQKYGIAWAELSTMIGQLNTSGLTGSIAGTAFSSMMAQMLKASNMLGFEVSYNDDGSMSVIGTLESIRAKFGDIKDFTPKVTMAFDQAFGQEGSRALTLLSSSLDTLKAQYEGVADSEGQSALMAERMSATYEDKLAKLENSRSAMQARLGKSANAINSMIVGVKTRFYNLASTVLDSKVGGALAGVFSGTMVAASGLLGVGGTALNVAAQFATFVAMTSQAGGMMALLKHGAALLGTPFRLVGSLAKGLGTGVVAIAKGLSTGIAAIGKGVAGLIPKMGAWIASAWSAAAAHWAMIWPILLVVAGVAALAAGAYLLIRHWDSVKKFFANLWDGMKGKASAFWEKTKAFASDAKDKVVTAWGNTKGFFSNLWGSFKEKAVSAWESLSERAPAFTSAIETAWGGLTGYFGGLWEGIKGTASSFWGILTGQSEFSLSAFTEPWNRLGEFFTGIWEGVKGVFSTAWDWVKKPFEKIGEWLGIKKADPLEVTASAVSSSDALTSAVAGQMQAASEYIPHSDAKRGPMSRLTAAGAAIPETMARGLSSSDALSEAVKGSFEATGSLVPDFSGRMALSGNWAEHATVISPIGSEERAFEGSSALQKLIGLVEALVGIAKGRKDAGVVIHNINLPDVDDIDSVIKFVNDLRNQFDGESA